MTSTAACRFAMLVATILLYPAVAEAWSEKIGFSATVHGHAFDQIEVESDGCSLRGALYFTAPEGAYADKKNEVRNHYRFRARIEFADRSFKTGIFTNDKPGRRRFRYVHDTSGEGCWAKQTQKLRGVHVDGCRNRACKVPEVN